MLIKVSKMADLKHNVSQESISGASFHSQLLSSGVLKCISGLADDTLTHGKFHSHF